MDVCGQTQKKNTTTKATRKLNSEADIICFFQVRCRSAVLGGISASCGIKLAKMFYCPYSDKFNDYSITLGLVRVYSKNNTKNLYC